MHDVTMNKSKCDKEQQPICDKEKKMQDVTKNISRCGKEQKASFDKGETKMSYRTAIKM